MKRLPSIWLLCLGLLLTRLLGVHVHACSGLEDAAHEHEAPHYADSGLLFGEFHHDDHGDKLELDLTGAVGAVPPPLTLAVDPALPAPDWPQLAVVSRWQRIVQPRGPPVAIAPRPKYLAPPLRGPPWLSLA